MPQDKRTFVEPTGWPTIKTTYETSLRKKIKDDRSQVPQADLMAGIDYWIARLNEDKTAIALGQPLPP